MKLSKTRIKITEEFDRTLYQPQYRHFFIWFDMRESRVFKSLYDNIDAAQRRIDKWAQDVYKLMEIEEVNEKRAKSRKVRFVDYP